MAYQTMGALRIVLLEEQESAMSMLLLDLERARMVLEDIRGERQRGRDVVLDAEIRRVRDVALNSIVRERALMDDAIGNYQRSNDRYAHRSITVGNEVLRMIGMMPTPELAAAMGRLGLLLLPETDASVGAQYPVPPPPPAQ